MIAELITQWLEKHEGAACDLVLQPQSHVVTRQQTVKQLVHGTKTYVECEPTVELASETFTLHELEEVVNEELAAPQAVVQTHDFLTSQGWLVQPTHQTSETRGS
ncbi:MAG: hypothetical protein N4J56_007064 [Chroococcidiopsis sp. SAG 2025]|uniref:hypothetical protein n=1 Tax=Chroococcidiopsis sp. SAG 2025 TaxID=171389 RepID=UPI002936FAD5|nr:hypothetical protein [Chroococcidiopsis sp. SAG 2025]MDV2997359.1 hypothetical protein [Chroococcidiopsis sp. SAG 2025]